MKDCETCIYPQPTVKSAPKCVSDWIWPEDYECPWGNECFPCRGDECDEYRKLIENY